MNFRKVGRFFGLGMALVFLVLLASPNAIAFKIGGPFGFGNPIHEGITQEALGEYFSKEYLDEVIEGVRCRDIIEFVALGCRVKDEMLPPPEVWDYKPQYHFDNCSFEEGIRSLFLEFDTVINTLISSDENKFKKARARFGFLVLHPAQDFYAHSNWVFVKAAKVYREKHRCPSMSDFDVWWDQDEVLGLFERKDDAGDRTWAYPANALRSGLWESVDNIKVENYCPQSFKTTHDEMNLDEPNAPGDKTGKKVWSQYCPDWKPFETARYLAVKETRVWFSDIKFEICKRAETREKAEELLKDFTGVKHKCD